MKWELSVCFGDKLERLPLKALRNRAFSSFSPIFLFVLPKIWVTHPHNNHIVLISKDRAISSQSLVTLITVISGSI